MSLVRWEPKRSLRETWCESIETRASESKSGSPRDWANTRGLFQSIWLRWGGCSCMVCYTLFSQVCDTWVMRLRCCIVMCMWIIIKDLPITWLVGTWVWDKDLLISPPQCLICSFLVVKEVHDVLEKGVGMKTPILDSPWFLCIEDMSALNIKVW